MVILIWAFLHRRFTEKYTFLTSRKLNYTGGADGKGRKRCLPYSDNAIFINICMEARINRMGEI